MAQTEKIDAEKTLATVTKADVDGMRKTWLTGRLLAVFTLGFFFIANLPYQYVEVESYWLGHLDLPESQQGGDKEMPVMGGWPLRYAVAYPHDAELRYREWRPLFLGLNVALGFASSWAICWFLAFRFRSLSVVPSRIVVVYGSTVCSLFLSLPFPRWLLAARRGSLTSSSNLPSNS